MTTTLTLIDLLYPSDEQPVGNRSKHSAWRMRSVTGNRRYFGSGNAHTMEEAMSIITNPTWRITSAERIERRTEALRVIMQSVVRVFANRKIKIRTDFAGVNAPAWTNGEDIFLHPNTIEAALSDAAMSDDDLRKMVLWFKGMVYHELDHILLTPRQGTDIMQRLDVQRTVIRDLPWQYAWNALEDQRIETWFTNLYTPTRRYFEATVLRWLLNEPSPQVLTLVWGRKYLPIKIRKLARKQFADAFGKQAADECVRIIDSYLTVQYPAHTLRGIKLIEDFARLLKDIEQRDTVRDDLVPQPTPDLMDPDPNSHDCGNDIRKGDTSDRQQKEAAERTEEAMDAEADELNAEDEDDVSDDTADETGNEDGGNESSESGEAGSDDSDDDNDADGGSGDDDTDDVDVSGATGGDEVDDEADEDNEDDGDLPTSDSSGSGDSGNDGDDEDSDDQGSPSGSTGHGATPTMTDAIEEALEDIDNDASFNDSLDRTVENFKGLVEAHDDRPTMHYNEAAVSIEAARLRKAIVTTLSDLKLELEPETVRRQTSGRINVRRAMQALDHEVDVFDTQTDEGDDIGGIEAVVLLDMSYSMVDQMGTASEAMWAIKSAFDTVDIPTTVIGYSDDHYWLYKPGERAIVNKCRRYGAISSTCPTSALTAAHDLLSKSEKPNRMLVSITDGEWSIEDDFERRIMAAMHKANVTSLFIGLGDDGMDFGSHRHQVAVHAPTPLTIPKVVSKGVASLMERAIREHV